MTSNLALGVEGARLAADLCDFAEDAHGAVGEGFEVFGRDAGGRFGHFVVLVGWEMVVLDGGEVEVD